MKVQRKCPVCGINLYERDGILQPSEESMPCGVSREGFEPGKGVDPLTKEQCQRCPFETEEEQREMREKLRELIFSGKNTYE